MSSRSSLVYFMVNLLFTEEQFLCKVYFFLSLYYTPFVQKIPPPCPVLVYHFTMFSLTAGIPKRITSFSRYPTISTGTSSHPSTSITLPLYCSDKGVGFISTRGPLLYAAAPSCCGCPSTYFGSVVGVWWMKICG